MRNLEKKIGEAILGIALGDLEGVSCFVICVKALHNRLPEDVFSTMQLYTDLLGHDMWNHVVILVTFVDLTENVPQLKEWTTALINETPIIVQKVFNLGIPPAIYKVAKEGEFSKMSEFYKYISTKNSRFKSSIFTEVVLAWEVGGIGKVFSHIKARIWKHFGWL